MTHRLLIAIAIIVIISNFLAYALMEYTNAEEDQAVYYGIIAVGIGAFAGLKYYGGKKK